MYLASFLSSALAATSPGAYVAWLLCDGAKVSEQVASQTSNFPDDHGASDMPSGLLPSVLSRPVGSNREGMPAVVRALLMMVRQHGDDDALHFVNLVHVFPRHPQSPHNAGIDVGHRLVSLGAAPGHPMISAFKLLHVPTCHGTETNTLLPRL